MNLPHLSFDGEILTSRLDVLKHWSEQLSDCYDRIMSRVENLEAGQKHHDALAAHENQLMRIIELFMEDDVRACTVIDYVIVFFRLVLAKLRQRGQDFDDVKQLHRALSDEDVAQTFRTALSKLGFPTAEQRAIRIVLEVLQHRKWPTSQVMTTSPGGDAQISSALLYLRLQQELDPVMSSALQRALCAAHECILTDMAISKATGHDVNLNASDVRKDDAYVDARVKYEDYASFDRNPRETETSGKLFGDEEDAEILKDRRDGPVFPNCSDLSESACNEGSTSCSSFEENGREKPYQSTSRTSSSNGTELDAQKNPLKGAFRTVTKTCCDGPHCSNSTDMKLDAADRAESVKDDRHPQKLDSSSTADGHACSTPERESPTTLDHSRLSYDPNFYVICYDVSIPASRNLSATEDEKEVVNKRAHHRHRPGSHVSRATNKMASQVEKPNQNKTGGEESAGD